MRVYVTAFTESLEYSALHKLSCSTNFSFVVPTNLRGYKVLCHLGLDSTEYKRKSQIMVVYIRSFSLSLSPSPSLPHSLTQGKFAERQLRAGIQ